MVVVPAAPAPTEAPVAPPEREEEQGLDPAREPPWRVICHDDPITTMEFVVEVLRSVFGISQARAYERMMRVHTSGAALIGSWPEADARARVARATAKARAQGFPLTFTLERGD